MHFKGKKLLMLVLVVLTMSLVFAQAGFAGSNGQQLKIHHKGAAMYKVTVTGYNQNHQWVKWQRSDICTSPWGLLSGCDTVTTTNWWWVGRVNIVVEDVYHNQFRCTAYVPKNQWWSNVYKTECP